MSAAELDQTRHLREAPKNRDREEALMQRGDCGRPGEIPEVLRRVPGEAGPKQSCRR